MMAEPQQTVPSTSLGFSKYIIAAPPYTNKSAGIWMLHYLTHTLNQLGLTAYVYAMNSNQPYTNPAFTTPILQELDPEAMAHSFIVYPEVISGNPLNGSNIIRYMLNHEGFIAGNKLNQGRNDFIATYHHTFYRTPDCILYCPATDFELFNSANTLPACERSLDLYYIGKGACYGECTPIPGALEITRDWPARKEELAILLRNTRFFYSYDNISSTNIDAVLCGAIPILLKDNPVPRATVFSDQACPPFLTGFSPVEFSEFFERSGQFRNELLGKAAEFPKMVLAFHELACKHFDRDWGTPT